MSHKAKTHAESGINKRASEAVYPSDILADTDLVRCGIPARGAWLWSLCIMWRDKTDRVHGTIIDFAADWRCTTDEARRIINELETRKVADVTKRNDAVTLLSRRLARAKKHRISAARRVADHRLRKCNEPVTSEKGGASSSSSSSSSISVPTVLDKEPSISRRPGKNGRLLKCDTYGEFGKVRLTPDEHAKLVAKHDAATVDRAISALDAWKESKGKTTKNDYAAMNAASWVWRAAEEAKNSEPYESIFK